MEKKLKNSVDIKLSKITKLNYNNYFNNYINNILNNNLIYNHHQKPHLGKLSKYIKKILTKY